MANEQAANQIDTEYSNKVKNEFLAVYKEIGEKLSSDEFLPYFDLLKEVHVNTDEAVEVFKKLLVDELTKLLEKMWTSQEISKSLYALQWLKDRFKDSPDPKWRPHGRSVEEQTVTLRVLIQKRRKKYYETQLENQKEQLKNLLAQVEESRQFLESHINKCQDYKELMRKSEENLSADKKVIEEEIVRLAERQTEPN